MEYFVYIMTNKPRGTLYIGITNNLIRRVYEHKNEFNDGFTRKYKIKMLAYFETYDYVHNVLKREKTLKRWKRDWKLQLIEKLIRSGQIYGKVFAHKKACSYENERSSIKKC